MSDWIEAAAKELCSDYDMQPPEAARIIRSHAPPVPQWCEKPTCLGWWACIGGDGVHDVYELMNDSDMERISTYTHCIWFGPFGPIPSQGDAT